MNLMKSTALAGALGALVGTLIAVQVRAGGDKVAFPEKWAEGTLYSTIDRYDIKQYRELWATPAAM
jgi:hypothetical protein